MKAKSFQISALSAQLHKDFDAILLYGTDSGEIHHVFTQIKKQLHLSTDALTALTKDQLKQTPLIATDEANTVSFIQSRRFLFVPEDTPFSLEALLHFIEHKKTDALLIVLGGNLPKTNALRLEAEKNPRVLAIACYQPTLQDIKKTVDAYLQLHHKKISTTVLSELCQKLSFNQELIFQELDKLLLYVNDRSEINTQDIQNCISNSSEFSLDTFCIDLADGKVDKVIHALTIFLESEESEATLFWTVRNYFEILLKIVTDTSLPTEQVIQKNLKPFQFYLKEPLLRQSRYWSPKTILDLLNKITKLEHLTRTTGYPKSALIEQAFLSLCVFVQKLTRVR